MLSCRPRNDAPGSRAMYGTLRRRSISATTSEPHSNEAGRPGAAGTSRPVETGVVNLFVETPIDRALNEGGVEKLADVEGLHLCVARAKGRLRVDIHLRLRERLGRRDGQGVEVVRRAHRGIVGRVEVLLQNADAERLVRL